MGGGVGFFLGLIILEYVFYFVFLLNGILVIGGIFDITFLFDKGILRCVEIFSESLFWV